ncbi:sulfatase family protein [Methylomonas sp. MgM2]
MVNTLTLLTIYPLLTAIGLSFFLALVALHSYSRTGPKIQTVIEKHFHTYAILAFLRLWLWSTAIIYFFSLPGPIVLFSISIFFGVGVSVVGIITSAISSIAVTSFYLICHHLLYIPSSLQASCQFRFSRLLPLWRILTPRLIETFKAAIYGLIFFSSALGAFFSIKEGDSHLASYFLCFLGIFFFIVSKDHHKDKYPPATKHNNNKPNLLMIGVDTLRIDRLGMHAYHRNLTPNIDMLCKQGTLFENCITPLARTAPSLASLLTGLWPHNHSIRDNYPDKTATRLNYDNLIKSLNKNSYITYAISDWAGADLKKIDFGFQNLSVPDDQWNLKFLLRQGPAYLRLFLSLFTHNNFGKRFLPELYYLAGKPLTSHLGNQCRKAIAELAQNNQPFLINLFTSTTHAPFGSAYPYYNLFTPNEYNGDSHFIMADLNTPEQIIESQESTSEHHDLRQIMNLYDSCVKEFDDEVGKVIDHLDKCGLRENTFIVIYSDHGTDFFETECWGQGNTLVGNDPSARIPLIISGPGVPKNMKFSHVCRSIDFMPTILDLLGMEIPENIDGVNLMPYIKENKNPNLYAYQETGVWMGKIPGLHPDQITYPDIIELLTIPDIKTGTLVIDEKYYPTVIKAKNRSIQNDRWKLIYIPTYRGPVYQLYDLKTDPYRNVIELYPEILAELKPKLDEWISHSNHSIM